jgi:hypothetical protein
MGTRRLTAAGAALLIAGLLVGCANAASTDGTLPATVSAQPSAVNPSDQSAAPSPAPSQTPPAPPLSLSPSAPGGPAPSQADQTISGQVEEGVERGCLVLHDPTGTYQLLGGDPTIVYAGANVVLTGHVVTGVMSYCMQGKPFQITLARRQ